MTSERTTSIVCTHPHLGPQAHICCISPTLPAALSPVTGVVTLAGNARLSSEVISLEISRKNLLELLFKRNSLFSLEGLLQKKQLSPYVFLEAEGTRIQLKAD